MSKLKMAKNSPLVLGIETSCDDTSLCLLKEGKVMAMQSFGQEEILSRWGGVVPEIASRNHLAKITPLLDHLLKLNSLKLKDIQLIGVTTHPGLLGPLLTGLNAAKSIALLNQAMIVPVNHLYAHLEAIHITQPINYPYLGLLVSGGHGIFFKVSSSTQFEVIGTTLDDAPGEAFDKGGKLLGLGYPAGKIIDQLAGHGHENSHFKFPIGLKNQDNAHLSFSGNKTSLRVYLEKNPDILNSKPANYNQYDEASQYFYDLCYAYQKSIVDSLVLKLKKAIQIAGNLPIVIGGGVACNSELRKNMQATFKDIHFVDAKYCTDNGAMIANYAYRAQQTAISFPDCLKMDAKSRFINKKDFIKT